MRHLSALAAAALLAAVTCGATAQSSTSSSISTPVYSYSQTTNYSSSQQNYDNAYRTRLNDLNNGRNFYNDRNGEVRTTTGTHTYGGTYAGFGATRSVTGESVNRSAAEDALHMHNRTSHLRGGANR